MEHPVPSTSLELDILHLSQRWEAERTIRNGDTPGNALRKGARPALAPIPANVAAAVNPFSLSAQRHKAVGRPQLSADKQQQQPSVRFVLPAVSLPGRSPAMDADSGRLARLPAASATPAALPPPSSGRGAAATCGAASCGSPSPCVIFRGRLSFAAEADSARKFDRPPTASKRIAGGAGLKRKLLVSPGADMAAAFPTLTKPSAKQRRVSLSDLCPAAGCAATCEADEPSPAHGGASLDKYWSDPLPLPVGLEAGLCAARGCHAGACSRPSHAAAAAAAPESDMLDTAASPASCCDAFCDGGAASPAPCAMDACPGDGPACVPPTFSPLPGAQRHALPTLDHPDCAFPSISVQTMRDLLTHGAAAFGLADFAVVDCRYGYEHEGGRLPGAVHLTTPDEVAAFLAAPRPDPDHWQRTALVFHCEFSTERGPRAAKWVRNQDREAHMHDYPALSHPHVFVLQGGYKAFWKAFPDLCEGGYVPMDHPDHTAELKVCHKAVRKAWAQTTRTYCRSQRQRRPSYCLRRSSGAAARGSRDADGDRADPAEAAGEVPVEEGSAASPAWQAAQHLRRQELCS